VFLIGILAFGIMVGWLAYAIVRWIFHTPDVSWGRTIVVGLAGSFVGGTLLSIIYGEFGLHISGFLGSLFGAIILVLGDQFILPRLRRS
jgi:uncharacterized membrane protein YeaQ/YmgE (transglycosylase-associated protein family)